MSPTLLIIPPQEWGGRGVKELFYRVMLEHIRSAPNQFKTEVFLWKRNVRLAFLLVEEIVPA